MVRHDAPCDESIALTVEVLEGIAHLLGQFRVAQGATAHAGIEPVFDFFTPLCGALVFGKLQQLRFQLREFFLRQAVGQSKGDGLEELLRIPVGEVSTGIPFFGSADVPVGFFGLICVHGGWWADEDVSAPNFPNSSVTGWFFRMGCGVFRRAR